MDPEIWYPYPRLGLKRESSGESIGWPEFRLGRSEIMGFPPSFAMGSIETLIAAKDGSNLS